MENETKEKKEIQNKANIVSENAVKKDALKTPSTPTYKKNKRQGGGGGQRHGGGPRRRDGNRPRSEFDNKIIGIRRVTRVVAGGRRFSFSVTMVLGDRKGSVGVGIGKASDTALAIEKATRDAKKHMIRIITTKDMSIPHEVRAKYSASVVAIRPAPGKGIVAGGAVRTVLDLAGIRDVGAKIISRSKNPVNNARAAIETLKKLKK